MPIPEVTRFAPTTSGRAHPGTLLSAMLTRLDAWSHDAHLILRMEDIDPSARAHDRCDLLKSDLEWFGFEWDEYVVQSKRFERHTLALDVLAERGLVYECDCSRTDLKRAGLVSASGGWVYPGTCRPRVVRDWRKSPCGLRVNLSGIRIELKDESGIDLSQSIDEQMGDPLVRRADGGFTYQWAVVVDDIESAVTRVVRGKDIASSTATQAAFYGLLGAPVPRYRHHLLLLEPHGQKLAKLHQSISVEQIRHVHSPQEVLGFLAWICGISDRRRAMDWHEVRELFSWEKVRNDDVTVFWNSKLEAKINSD